MWQKIVGGSSLPGSQVVRSDWSVRNRDGWRISVRLLFVCAVGGMLVGCMDSLEDQVKKSPKSIMKKTTQEIGKFDPAAGRLISDSKIRATNPVTGPLEAYGPMIEQISKMQIDQSVIMFQVTNNRYPTYEEFMEQIVKQNNVQLPVLPAKMEYQYDEEAHKLVVVYPEGTKPEDIPQFQEEAQESEEAESTP